MRFTNSDGKAFDVTIIGSEGGYPMIAITDGPKTCYLWLPQIQQEMDEWDKPRPVDNPYGYHREADI